MNRRLFRNRRRYKLAAKNITLYIIIPALMILLLAYDPGTTGIEPGPAGGVKMAPVESAAFIKGRSVVIYELTESKSLEQLNRMFGLRLKPGEFLRYNKSLTQRQLGKIPKGTRVKLYIQSRKTGDGDETDN